MRPLVFLAPFLLVAAAGGCVAPGSYQQGYAQPGYAVQTQIDEPTFYDDRPAVFYGSQPSYIIEDPSLGWGWRGPDRHWHDAPDGWRGPGDWDRHRQQDYRRQPSPVYRQEQRGGYRQEQQNYGRQQEQRQPERQQARPVQQQQQRPQPQPQPQRQENQRRTCPAGQLIC